MRFVPCKRSLKVWTLCASALGVACLPIVLLQLEEKKAISKAISLEQPHELNDFLHEMNISTAQEISRRRTDSIHDEVRLPLRYFANTYLLLLIDHQSQKVVDQQVRLGEDDMSAADFLRLKPSGETILWMLLGAVSGVALVLPNTSNVSDTSRLKALMVWLGALLASLSLMNVLLALTMGFL